MKTSDFVVAAISGAIAGGIGGILGGNFVLALLAGGFAGGPIGLFFGAGPWSSEDTRLAIEAASPAGLAGGIVGAITSNVGLLGIFLCGIAGWVIGLLFPAILVAVTTPD